MKNSLIVARNESQVIGVLSGWDRIIFRGCCPLFAFLDGMLKWLLHMGIWLTDYSQWALAMVPTIIDHTLSIPEIEVFVDMAGVGRVATISLH